MADDGNPLRIDRGVVPPVIGDRQQRLSLARIGRLAGELRASYPALAASMPAIVGRQDHEPPASKLDGERDLHDGRVPQVAVEDDDRWRALRGPLRGVVEPGK